MKQWIFLLAVLVGCQVNEANAPELFSDDPQQIGATSVVMGAAIKEIGPVRPVNYGFLWDKHSDISIATSQNKVILGAASAPKKFSIKLDNLTPATVYYYRGFAANADNTKFYYSGVVSFTTLP